MKPFVIPAIVATLVLALAAGAATTPTPPMTANPLLLPSSLPHQFPRFDLIRDEHYVPAFEQGMAEQLQVLW